jgi:hypothetical protein
MIIRDVFYMSRVCRVMDSSGKGRWVLCLAFTTLYDRGVGPIALSIAEVCSMHEAENRCSLYAKKKTRKAEA